METALIKAFEKMGARAKLQTMRRERSSWNRRKQLWFVGEPIRVNILRDQHGPYFDIVRRADVMVQARDVVPDDRHLLLTIDSSRSESIAFLCGHDEREWFAAAIPEDAKARTVQQAKDALKPQEVWDAMKEYSVPMEDRDKRFTAAFIRQGEWFFIPCPDMEIHWDNVIFHEPIQRGAGKPHICEAMYRRDGQEVLVSDDYPNGLTRAEFFRLPVEERRRTKWEQRVRNAEVFVRGRIRHHDHATIHLPFWHKVVMNTETRSRAMANLAFLD
jgi:hypothetical protein